MIKEEHELLHRMNASIAKLGEMTIQEYHEYSEDHWAKRVYVAQELKKRYPDRKLLNFSFSPGDIKNWRNVTKDQVLEQVIQAIETRGEPIKFNDSNRPQIDVIDFVAKFDETVYTPKN